MNRQIVDERVKQESHRVMAKNFRVTMMLLALLLLTKTVGVVCGLPWYVLLPEACGLISGVAVWGVWMSVRGLWGQADERIASEKEVCLSTSWTVVHCVALLVCTVLLMLGKGNGTVNSLTALALTVIMFITMGRLTRGGLMGERDGSTVWKRVLPVTAGVLALTPALMWLMCTLRQVTCTLWMYVLVEVVMLISCLLGGLLATSMRKQSAANAEKQLEEAEGADEE